ncbi:hypothetical protein SDC9_174135 [bioreactor metagenome]|uniref:Uncharacterized protein n=1 Tax=bioreactor metagenome TaxID=1076179 RepID=A0A645GKP1_9ZZZZ
MVLIEIEDVDVGLGGQQEQIAQRFGIQPGLEDTHPGVQRLLGRGPRLVLRTRFLLDLGLFLQPGQRLLEGLQVGEDQFGADRVDIGGRVDAAVHMGDIFIGEDPGHLADGICLANVGEEGIAHTFTL